MSQSVVLEVFDRDEFASRLERVRARMEGLALDAILVTAPENILYLCGYQTKAVFTFQFLLLHRARGAHFVTRQMEKVNADIAAEKRILDGYTLYRDDEDPVDVAARAIARVLGTGGRVGIELGSWTMSAKRYQDLCRACPSIDWVDVTALVDQMRLVKSPAELRVLREAAAITDRITAKARAAVAPGASEDDLARIILDGLVAEGSEYPGSWPNVLVGRRTGFIHAAWAGEQVGRDDLVLIEIAGVRERYHAPALSTVLVGAVAPEIRAAAAAIEQAHQEAVRAMEPGRPAGVINQAAAAALARHNCACDFARRSGYSVGTGFPPSWGAQWQLSLNSTLEVPLEIGMTFHVVLVAHCAGGRAIGLGRTVALLSTGPECWTDGRFSSV